MNNRSSDTPLILLSPEEVWDRVDPLASDVGAEPGVANLRELPYAQLLCPGFERLCYELLIAEGHSPRFFGRSGQRDYGVDIVVETGNTRTVYQCKNRANLPSWTDVRDAVTKFESAWLGAAGLPRPEAFVYCCPHPLDDKSLGENFVRFKGNFRHRTGVDIDFWDKHALDTRLRRLPDIVAGLFSGSYAEHFCNRDDWMDAPWIRVHWGEPRYASIKRFLGRHRHGTIHVAAPDEERFQETLSSSSVLAIRGLPGSGKTLTSLELACGLRAPLRRIYYATFKDTPDSFRLWKSVSRRGSLPAVLLLDDCHLNLEQTGIVLERLRPELSDSKGGVKLVLVLRDLPGSTSGMVVDAPDWLVQLDQDGLVMDMKTDLSRTHAVTVHLRPELTGLSPQRLERLHDLSGGDLLLLDEILRSVESPQDLDAMDPHSLYDSLRKQYFGGNRRLPTVQRLAGLAQFELTPAASFLDDGWQAEEKGLVASLMTELFTPHRYQFLHSTLAELVLRALLALEMEPPRVENAVIETTATELISYFRHLAAGTDSASRESAFMQNLETMLHSRLKLTKATAEAQIKAKVLNEKFIRDGIEEHLHDCSFHFLHVCLMLLTSVSHPVKERYIGFIERRFHMLFENMLDGRDSAGIATIGTGFMTLARNAPSSLEAVQDKYGAVRFLRLIAANGTLFELFSILRHATPTLREELLARLDEVSAGKLVDKTIAAGRSIESFHYILRKLYRHPSQRKQLEKWLGIDGWRRLLVGVGTLNSLIQITRAMSGEFRKTLLAASSGLRVADWQGIIARGLFLNACTFAGEELAAYPEPSQTAFRKALGETAAPLAAKATWFDLNPSRSRVDPNSPEGQILQVALRPRIEGLKPEDLLGLDFRESVNGIAFAWRERHDLRPVLAARLWEILPDPADRPREKGEVAVLHLVLVIVRSELVAVEDVRRLLEGIHGFLTHSACKEIHTFPLFLLLWNVCAIHYERGVGVTPSFEGALPDSLIQILLELLRQRVVPRGPNKEKLAQLALTGLISFLVPQWTEELRRILAPLTGPTKWLYPEAQAQTFVPALFSLEGIGLAIEFLRQHVEQRDNLR
jgi:hypothetical protein